MSNLHKAHGKEYIYQRSVNVLRQNHLEFYMMNNGLIILPQAKLKKEVEIHKKVADEISKWDEPQRSEELKKLKEATDEAIRLHSKEEYWALLPKGYREILNKIQ